MPINAGGVVDNYYYSDRFKTLVRSEKELLVNSASEALITEPYLTEMFKYDFYALLRHLQVPKHLWWATAFINNVTSPFKTVAARTSILVLNEQVLQSSIVRTNSKRG